jgi:integrase
MAETLQGQVCRTGHACPLSSKRSLFQIRNRINFQHTAREREAEAKALIEILEIILSEGWNPHVEEMKAYLTRTRQPTETLPKMPFNAALDFALKNKQQALAPKSYKDIHGVKEFIQKAAKTLFLDSLPIGELKRTHVKQLLEQVGKERQREYDKQYREKLAKGKTSAKRVVWTGNSHNKYRNFLQILLTELVEYEALEYNPCDKIGKRPEIQTGLHRHATDQEKAIIKEHLQQYYPGFYTYLATEFATGMRPIEICGLRVSDYDSLNLCFHIQHAEGKTRKARMVPIPNSLMPLLGKLNIENYPNSYFIFGRGFKPAATRERRENITKWWKDIVKDGLGINVSLYSFKGLGGEAKSKAGISAEMVSAQFGHTTVGMTMRYLHGERDRINKEIIERTPDF